jgi:hypothetical protein
LGCVSGDILVLLYIELNGYAESAEFEIAFAILQIPKPVADIGIYKISDIKFVYIAK